MATFNIEIVLSLPLGFCDSACIVEIRGSRERTVQHEDREEGSEP